jgi:hypothetical protein
VESAPTGQWLSFWRRYYPRLDNLRSSRSANTCTSESLLCHNIIDWVRHRDSYTDSDRVRLVGSKESWSDLIMLYYQFQISILNWETVHFKFQIRNERPEISSCNTEPMPVDHVLTRTLREEIRPNGTEVQELLFGNLEQLHQTVGLTIGDQSQIMLFILYSAVSRLGIIHWIHDWPTYVSGIRA